MPSVRSALMASDHPRETIGLDLGGTKLSVATLRDGELHDLHQIPTRLESTDRLLDQLVEAIEDARSEHTDAVGLGIPSVVDWASGRARSSVNIPLADVPIRGHLSERLGLPVFVDNDAACAALAEAHTGEGPIPGSLVMFTVGTGVGGGIVLGGRVWRGATGAAAELGHMLIAADLRHGPPGTSERFPQPGSLESLAAGRALDGLASHAARRNPTGALGRRASERGLVSGPDVVDLARAGDPEARRLVAELGERLGIGIANAINFLDPDVVAISGGVSSAGELLLGSARETAKRFILPGVGTQTEIRLALTGRDAGVHGAALLAQTEAADRAHSAATEGKAVPA